MAGETRGLVAGWRVPAALAAWTLGICLACTLPGAWQHERPPPSPVDPADAAESQVSSYRRSDPPGERPTSEPAPALPSLDHEPVLQVLLARAPRVSIELEAPVDLEAPGLSSVIGPGTVIVEALDEGWRIAGSRRVAGQGVLRSGGRPVFGVDAIPLFGEVERLRLAGDLLIHADQGEVEVIERVRMEDYLVGVVSAEMNPRWPSAALSAQAIVARSYAAARWMERHDRPWHLHWHFGIDMAYRGWKDGSEAVARAVAATRGEVLTFGGFPVLALFHASSGGRTEAFERVKPGVLAPDGRTPIAPAMQVADDLAAVPGAAGLGLSETHARWKSDIPLPEVARALKAWSTEAPGRPTLGEIESISIASRHPDSGRTASVHIRHRLQGVERSTPMPAVEFRMAVGPVRVRSLLWDRCVMASKAPGYLVLEGRGFGHGCGLSQVSAWHLAKQGESAEAIVARFYVGAEIERRY